MKTHRISTRLLDFEDIEKIMDGDYRLELSEEAVDRIEKCRRYLDRKMSESDTPIYGINTGFGALADVRVSREDLNKLQENLVMSHACGTGEEVPQEIVKLMLLLKLGIFLAVMH